jgi:hypothetical protein
MNERSGEASGTVRKNMQRKREERFLDMPAKAFERAEQKLAQGTNRV